MRRLMSLREARGEEQEEDSDRSSEERSEARPCLSSSILESRFDVSAHRRNVLSSPEKSNTLSGHLQTFRLFFHPNKKDLP